MRRMLRSLAAACSLALVAGASAALPAAEMPGQLRAGAAAANITPPLGELIVGGWRPYPAKHIHDELHARCLVLDDGTTRIAFVICDNVGIPREVYDAARELIPESAGLQPENVLMAATHTHSATTARSESKLDVPEKLSPYQAFLAQRIADGLARAANNLEPAQIGWGTASVPEEVFNRRWFMVEGPHKHLRNPFGGTDKVRMNPPRGSSLLIRPAGPVDPQVSFLSIRSLKGRPISLLANYSLHYVGGTGPGAVSADYFGYFADAIQQRLGADRLDPPFVGILTNGTSGDVNNIDFQASTPVRRKPYEKMQEVANRVADAVQQAHAQIEFRDRVPLAMRHAELTLATRRPNEHQLELARLITDRPDDAPGWHTHEATYAKRILMQHAAPQKVTVPLQAVRIGDVGIAAIPFEVFTEIGLEIKQNSPLPATFTIELANGSYGYLPTPEQHSLGGYETWLGTNLVETEASRKISRTVLELLNELSNQREQVAGE